ncbi:alpha/beta hydrolase [Mucilaginibacter sp. CSA2-8R]|uniref:alpha/beta hydrolase n=1 Tax=Mucilaginibacter sp. CSA2-8R TaxID=3141542 RepID=UPI00315DED1F
MQKIFLISGLGADRRLFNKLDLPGYELVYMDWLEPEEHDTLTSYAQKLINYYGVTPGAVVMGVSMGGMLTVEISSMVKLSKAVIVSSVKEISEFPFYFKWFRRVPVYKVIPHGFYTSMGFLIKPLFGELKGKSGFLFVDMIRKTSPKFMRWAMHSILQWQPTAIKGKLYHIIGNKDIIFPYKKITTATHIVEGGSHDMIYTRGREISKLILSILNDETA